MKNSAITSIFLTLLAFFLLLRIFTNSYTERTKYELKNMKEPIILKDKEKMTFWYSVTLEDGDGEIYKWGSTSGLANSIGEMYKVGDTIPVSQKRKYTE